MARGFFTLPPSPELTITLEQDTFFVCPSSSSEELEQPLPGSPSDPVLQGTVVLSLPTPRAVGRIKVTLEGLCDASAGEGTAYESRKMLEKVLEIDLRGKGKGGEVEMARGMHA